MFMYRYVCRLSQYSKHTCMIGQCLINSPSSIAVCKRLGAGNRSATAGPEHRVEGGVGPATVARGVPGAYTKRSEVSADTTLSL